MKCAELNHERTDNIAGFSSMIKLSNPQQQEVERLSNSRVQPAMFCLLRIFFEPESDAPEELLTFIVSRSFSKVFSGVCLLKPLLNHLETINLYYRIYQGEDMCLENLFLLIVTVLI